MNTELKFVTLDLDPKKHPLFPPHFNNDRAKPEDVLIALNTTIEQVSACYKDCHYIAAIGLCGRIIEILIVNAYKKEMQEDPLIDRIDDDSFKVTPLSVRKMRRKLKGNSIHFFEDQIDSKLNFIQDFRNISVHGSVTIPTEKDAKDVVEYTIQFVEHIIYYYYPDKKAIDHVQRGKVRANFGNHKEAIIDFNNAIEKDPNSAAGYHYRGKSQVVLGNYQAAISDFTEAVELKRNLAANYFNRGIANFNLT